MAWNEPGGNKNDPWKNRGGNNQGPPDLDDIFKNLFSKLGGAGNGNKGSSNNGGLSGKVLSIIVMILIFVWGISGFYTIKEAERGVALRFGEYVGAEEPGLRWKASFIDVVIPVDVKSIRNLPSSGFMLTEDENVVRVEMEIQYRVVEPYQYTFAVTDADESLRHALDSAIRYVVGHSSMNDVLTSGREVARQKVWEELQKIVGPYNIGVDIVDVNFKDARPPEEVKAAFDDAIAAQEDEERFIREADAYAREIEPRARGQVKRMEQDATAYRERVKLEAEGEVARFEQLLPQYNAAPDVTRDRLYLETLEEVYSNTSKIMVDNQGSGNMMYLPLDKILDRQSNLTPPKDARNTVEGLRNSPTGTQNVNSTPATGRDRFRSGRN